MAKVTQEHVDARLESIRKAAITMFVKRGVEGATMQDIAGEAGLSAGAIYRYYPSKEHLLRAVWDGCIEETRALFERSAAAGGVAAGAHLRPRPGGVGEPPATGCASRHHAATGGDARCRPQPGRAGRGARCGPGADLTSRE